MQEITQTRTLPESKKCTQLLLQHRLIWYRRIMTERLLRFKHIIIIILACSVPTLSSIPYILGSPLLFVLSPRIQADPWLISMVSLLIHAAYVLWIAAQKEALMGGKARKYLLTLPIPTDIWKSADFKLLLIANNVFWLPLLFSFIYLFISADSIDLTALMALHWLLLTVSLLVSQWLYLHKRVNMLLLVTLLTSGVLGVATLITNEQLDISLTLTSMIAVSLIGTQYELSDSLFSQKKKKLNKAPTVAAFSDHALWKKWSSLLKINLAILFRGYRQESYLRLFLCISFLIMIYQLSLFSSGGIESMYPAAGAACVLFTSGWYKKLAIEHQKYAAFLKSLPAQPGFWSLLDIFSLSSLVFLLQLVFFAPYFIAQELQPSTFFTLISAEVPLTIIIYLCQTRLKKQSLLASTLSTGVWLYLLLI